jgi:hypothetical protein
MKRTEAVLAAVALVSAVIYALACRPAWSPSGKQVVFPYAYGEDERTGVALYDIETREVRTLVEEQDGSLMGAQSAWTSDGKAIYTVRRPDEMRALVVLRIDPAGGEATEVAAIGGLSKEAPQYFPPVLVDDKHIWLSYLVSEEPEQVYCARIDIESGEVKKFFESPTTYTMLYDFGKAGYWYMKVKEDEDGADSGAEIGRFDPATAKLTSAYTVKDASVAPFIAVEPSGARVAIAVEAEEGQALRVVTLSDGSKRDIMLPESVSELGGMEWVGETVWIGATVYEGEAAGAPAEQVETAEDEGDDESDDMAEVALLAVDIAKGEVKVKPLGKGPDNVATLQPAVSPDGKFLAMTILGSEEETLPALLILDLTARDKEPVRVRAPGVIVESTDTTVAIPAVESTGK